MDEIYYPVYEAAVAKINQYKITHLKWYEDPRYNKDLRMIKTEDMIGWIDKPTEEKTDHVIHDALLLSQEIKEKLVDDGYKYHSTWYENMCRDMNLNKRMISQEIESDFVGSGDNVIDGRIIQKQQTDNVREPAMKDKEWENNVWIWSLPQKDHRYIAALDVSRGDSEDATGYCIIDYDTYEQVLEYHGKVQPDIAAQVVFKYSQLYNAMTTFDITGGMGIAATTKLKEMNFPKKLYHYDTLDDIEAFYLPDKDAIPGINFAKKNRRGQIVAALEEAVSRGDFKVRSERVIFEMRKFIYRNGRPDHMKGSHDDLIFALGMCLFVANSSFRRLEKSDSMTKAMLDSWKISSNTTETRSTTMLDSVLSSPDPDKSYEKMANENIIRNTRDFSWVFGNINRYKDKDK